MPPASNGTEDRDTMAFIKSTVWRRVALLREPQAPSTAPVHAHPVIKQKTLVNVFRMLLKNIYILPRSDPGDPAYASHVLAQTRMRTVTHCVLFAV
ncbi:hypothetical protein NDU88_003090 [Pleurodeles waltl]|uniref:Uncharacterized protein n=1 Tax=Pleurodeles waltl TaxID=8319 RepID=A0AAV7QBZ2_PLEWA|nr:hypothetical protein NDU88_003090 [Pleurodeles waltl]